MNPISRRSALSSIALGTAGLGLGCAATSPAKAQTARAATSASPPLPPVTGPHQPVPLPFAAGSLRGLSEQLITSHHQNNYVGAVKNLNRVEQELSRVTAETPAFVVAALHERALAFRNSKSLHEAYFGNLGGDGKRAGAVETALAQAFGSSGQWEAGFRYAGAGLGGGSGWVVLALELDTGELRTVAMTSHTQALSLGVPLLVMDMYEHSYQMDFGAAVPRYLDAFFANVQWDEVNRRLERAGRAAAAWRARA